MTPSPILRRLWLLATLLWLGLAQATEPAATAEDKPLNVLLITGGCCHNYLFQSLALTTGVEKRIHAEFTVVNGWERVDYIKRSPDSTAPRTASC